MEVGLESLITETQQRVAKIHPPNLFEDFVSNVAKLPGLSLVTNYMTGFPWEDPVLADAKLQEARSILESQLGERRGRLEHNRFELERQSPMARQPQRYEIDSRRMTYWPWASVIEYSHKQPYKEDSIV